MKITVSQLRQIIKEEVKRSLNEEMSTYDFQPGQQFMLGEPENEDVNYTLNELKLLDPSTTSFPDKVDKFVYTRREQKVGSGTIVKFVGWTSGRFTARNKYAVVQIVDYIRANPSAGGAIPQSAFSSEYDDPKSNKIYYAIPPELLK